MSSIKIDRSFMREFTADAEEALNKVAEKYGIKATVKGGSFARDGSNATFKVEMAAPNASTGEFQSREAQDFKRFAKQYGFEPGDLGSTFTVRGTIYRITGLKTRRPKFPISAERTRDGKLFKFPVEAVRLPTRRREAIEAAKTKFVEGLTPGIKSAFVGLACQLSPENVSCDGECSPSETRRRHADLMRQWGLLEMRAGQKVSESEAWGFDSV